MVIVKGPLFSLEASGKLGDLVYGHNQFSQWVSEPKAYEYVISPEQAQWRYAFYYLMLSWDQNPSCTPARRSMWNEWALNHPITNRLGQVKYLSGRHWFLKLNYYRKRAGLGLHYTPPIHSSCSIFPVFTFTQEDWGIVVDCDITLTGDDLAFFSTVKYQNTTRNFMPHLTEFIRIAYSTTSFPFCCIPNSDLWVPTKRYFFKYLAVDGNGCASPHQISFLDCAQRSNVTTLLVDSDSYLNSSHPDTNYSSSTSLPVRFFSVNRTDCVLKFDLSSIATYSVCTSALLYFKCSYYTANCDCFCHSILLPWSIDEVTWNSRLTGIAWSTGGLAPGVDCSTDPLDSVTVTGLNEWFSLDVTSWVNDVLSLSITNYGLILANFTTDAFFSFYSKDYSSTDCPYLEIHWA